MNACIENQYEKVRERMCKNYNYEIPDRPPLIIRCGEGLDPYTFFRWLDNPEAMISYQSDRIEKIKQIGSDAIPVMQVAPVNSVLIPSMFGAKILEKKSAWAEHFDTEIEEIIELFDVNGGLMKKFENNIALMKQKAREDAHLCVTYVAPTETAIGLLGVERLLMEMYDNTDNVHKLFKAITNAHIKTILHLKGLLNESNDQMVSHTLTYFPCNRIAGDSVANLSPDLIQEFFNPYMQELGDGVGGNIHFHYCSIETNPLSHVWKKLMNCKRITGLETHHYTFNGINDPVELQKMVEERFVISIYWPSDKNEFERLSRDLVKRWKKPTGIIFKTDVKSVEEGRVLMKIWKDIWGVI